MTIPLTKPNPARLSENIQHLRDMEERAVFSNFGPLNSSFEQEIKSKLFGGVGECATVCNATIGLMLAIRQALESRPKSRRRYALMPSFTFAAAAQAAQWNRLTPLFCDIDPQDWSASFQSLEQMLAKYEDEIAIVLPYAAFGYNIDLNWYERLQQVYNIPVIVDAAASLGTISSQGTGFGTGFSGTVVYSMHVTKSFSTSEGGLVYSANPETISTIRAMSNFGFSEPRNASVMGLNGKLSEVAALLAHLRLDNFDLVMQRRSAIMERYRAALSEVTFQQMQPRRQAHQFIPVLLPARLTSSRLIIQQEMAQRGVATATYFSPHVAEQTLFRRLGGNDMLPVTEEIAGRMLTLPLFDTMTDSECDIVIQTLKASLLSAKMGRSTETLIQASTTTRA